MKICEKCGAINSDSRFFCMDCSEKLGDSVTQREQTKIEQSIDSKIEDLYNDNDPLHVSLFDKIMGFISLGGIALCVILWIIGLFTEHESGFLWFGVLFFTLAVLEAFVPKLSWGIEKLRLSFLISNSEDAEPSSFYKICRKAAILIMAGVGVVILAFAILDLRSENLPDSGDNIVIVTAGDGNIIEMPID